MDGDDSGGESESGVEDTKFQHARGIPPLDSDDDIEPVKGNNKKFNLKHQPQRIQDLLKDSWDLVWAAYLRHNPVPDALERIPITREVLVEVAKQSGAIDIVERLNSTSRRDKFCASIVKMASIPSFFGS